VKWGTDIVSCCGTAGRGAAPGPALLASFEASCALLSFPTVPFDVSSQGASRGEGFYLTLLFPQASQQRHGQSVCRQFDGSITPVAHLDYSRS